MDTQFFLEILDKLNNLKDFSLQKLFAFDEWIFINFIKKNDDWFTILLKTI